MARCGSPDARPGPRTRGGHGTDGPLATGPFAGRERRCPCPVGARSTGPLARRRAVDGAGDPDRRARSRRRLVDRAAAFAGRAGEGRGASRTPLRGHRQSPARTGVVAGPGRGGGPGGSADAGELPARHAVELAGANDRRALRAGPRVRQDAVAQPGCRRPQPGLAVDQAAGHRDARRAACPAGPGRQGSRRRAVVRRGAAGGRGPARRRQRSRWGGHAAGRLAVQHAAGARCDPRRDPRSSRSPPRAARRPGGQDGPGVVPESPCSERHCSTPGNPRSAGGPPQC